MSTTGCLTASLAVLLGGCPSRAARQKSWSMSCSASQAATILSLSTSVQWHEELLKREWRRGAEGQRHHHHQAGVRHRQDGSADGGLQRHRANVDEPLVGAPKRNVELGRVPIELPSAACSMSALPLIAAEQRTSPQVWFVPTD